MWASSQPRFKSQPRPCQLVNIPGYSVSLDSELEKTPNFSVCMARIAHILECL